MKISQVFLKQLDEECHKEKVPPFQVIDFYNTSNEILVKYSFLNLLFRYIRFI